MYQFSRINLSIYDWSHGHAVHVVPGGQSNNGPWRIARFPRRALFKACKHETHLEKEQARQSVRRICAGLAKLLALQKWERFSVDLLDPRQSMRSGFHLEALPTMEGGF